MGNPAIEFFNSIPDDILAYLAQYDRNELSKICNALTLDLYFEEYESISDR